MSAKHHLSLKMVTTTAAAETATMVPAETGPRPLRGVPLIDPSVFASENAGQSYCEC